MGHCASEAAPAKAQALATMYKRKFSSLGWRAVALTASGDPTALIHIKSEPRSFASLRG